MSHQIHYLYSPLASSHVRGQQGVVTIVTQVFQLQSNTVVKYGISVCVPGDNFCKQIGIDLAVASLEGREIVLNDRVRKPVCGEFEYKYPLKYRGILYATLVAIANSTHQLPKWARQRISWIITTPW